MKIGLGIEILSLAVIIVAICATVIWLFSDRSKGETPKEVQYSSEITVEQRLAERAYEMELNSAYDVYYSLPSIILQNVLEDIGANATVIDITQRYQTNREYYISKYVSSQFEPTIEGPDADNIESISITTTIKDTGEELLGKKKISLSIGDTIK